jgi:hypothetical protein
MKPRSTLARLLGTATAAGVLHTGREDRPSAAECFLSLESDSVYRVRTTDYDSPSKAGSTSWSGSAQ